MKSISLIATVQIRVQADVVLSWLRRVGVDANMISVLSNRRPLPQTTDRSRPCVQIAEEAPAKRRVLGATGPFARNLGKRTAYESVAEVLAQGGLTPTVATLIESRLEFGAIVLCLQTGDAMQAARAYQVFSHWATDTDVVSDEDEDAMTPGSVTSLADNDGNPTAATVVEWPGMYLSAV